MLHLLLELRDTKTGQTTFQFLSPGTTDRFETVEKRVLDLGCEPTQSPIIFTKKPNMRITIIRESDQETIDKFLEDVDFQFDDAANEPSDL